MCITLIEKHVWYVTCYSHGIIFFGADTCSDIEMWYCDGDNNSDGDWDCNNNNYGGDFDDFIGDDDDYCSNKLELSSAKLSK